MINIRTGSPEETEKIGEVLGALLTGGEVICLDGDLGTGKTAFTKGIAKGMGIEGYITSPTFALVNEYFGRLILYHFDVYRIYDEDEILEIGFEDYIYSQGVSVIEWSELIQSILPIDRINVKIEKLQDADDEERIISMEFKGNPYERLYIEFIRESGKNENFSS